MRWVIFFATTLLLLCFGGVIYAMKSNAPAPPQDLGINFSEPKHWVTSQMELESKALANSKAPEQSGKGDHGETVLFGQEESAKPQFVVFIKSGCPCSIDAQPIFNHLATKFKGKAQFVGVIDASDEKAKDYGSQFSVRFPVVADPQLSIIHGFKAEASTYSALVAKNGHVIKMWPGYCVSYLAEMNELLSAETGTKITPFDPMYAPVRKASGCAFVPNG